MVGRSGIKGAAVPQFLVSTNHELISTKLLQLRELRELVSSSPSRRSMKFVSGESKLSSVPRRVRPAPASTPELALWVLLPLFFEDGEDALRVRFAVG